MGWLFGYESKAEVIAACRKPAPGYEVLASSVRGNRLWAVFRNVESGEAFIVLNLLSKSEGLWGYKDMDESMGPCYHDCPVSYLDMVTEPVNEWSRKWREKVREVAARRDRMKKVVKEGVTLRNRGSRPETVMIVGRLRRSWVGEDVKTGFRYRLTRSFLEGAEVVA